MGKNTSEGLFSILISDTPLTPLLKMKFNPVSGHERVSKNPIMQKEVVLLFLRCSISDSPLPTSSTSPKSKNLSRKLHPQKQARQICPLP